MREKTSQLSMKPLKNNQERELSCDEINQMWRYGGGCENIKDGELENKLLDILRWIEQELQRL